MTPERSRDRPLAARRSLGVRLPLLISALLVAAVAAVVWAAYREVEGALVRGGSDRAMSAANQVGNLLERPVQDAMQSIRRVAEDAHVLRYLLNPTDDTREGARMRLTQLAPTGPRRIELWTAAGSRVLDISIPGAAIQGAAPRELPAGARPSRAGVSPFHRVDHVAFFDIVGEIAATPAPPNQAPASARLGYLVVRSTFSVNPPGIIGRLVGGDALVEIGNTNGDVWTDLSAIVPAPPVDVTRNGPAEYRAANGEMRLGAASSIRGTPWAVWVEFSRSAIVAPARVFLRRMIVIALAFVAIGAVVVGLLSVRITRPLRELTRAAEAVAAGDYSRTVVTERRDEIGALGQAFNAMAGDIARNIMERERTEKIRLENRIIEEQNRRMVEANRLKSEFVANMSHELRTPLNAIIGFAELMHTGKVGPLSPQHREYLGDILTSSKHLLGLINDVLDLAKVEAGRMDFRPETVDLNTVVAEVRDTLRGLAASKRLRVDAFVDADVATVTVDPARVKQILYNYLSNAIKFTPEDGTIQIRIVPQGPAAFRIDVQDTGVGIPKEHLSKLFIEFQQLDTGAAKRYQGTGLGLALTRRLAEAQGGEVAVRSTPGEGSTFSALLPRRMSAAVRHVEAGSTAPGTIDGR